jgi:hypothetical protein
MFRFVLLSVCVASLSASARPKPVTGAIAPTPSGGWAPHQATGAPNCPTAGDNQLAWATLGADSGEEWLELDYETAVPIQSIVVHQNDNPGAIIRVEARDDEAVTVLWKGTSPKVAAPAKQVVTPRVKISARTIRIVLDTSKVPGWNEIDAVELVGRDGSRQWAKTARASSTYAAAGGQASGIWKYVGQPVALHIGGQIMNGTLLGIEGNWANFQAVDAKTPILLNLERIDWVRAR